MHTKRMVYVEGYDENGNGTVRLVVFENEKKGEIHGKLAV